MSTIKDQQDEFYSNLDQTFRSPGWSMMVRGWTEEKEQLPVAVFFNAQTMDDVNAARVRYQLLDELISLPNTIEQQRLNLVDEDNE